MAELKLLRGQIALIDDEDLPKVVGIRWTLSTKGYVICMTGPQDHRRAIWLHRLIAGTPDGFDTDHEDRNKLNNRKSNLRTATRLQNTGNRVKQSNGKTSRYKGVHWHSIGKGYWRAVFAYRDQSVKTKVHKLHLGLFTDEMEAAKAYNEAAKSHFGEFALLNPI